MDDRPPARMFRGSELPRMLLLLAIALAGWAGVWYYLVRDPAGPAEPETVVAGVPRPVVPDRSAAFESVTDKTPVGFRDSAAIKLLVDRARESPPAALAAEARRDVLFAQLWERPDHYRGVPVHVLGTALRVLRYESKYSRTGWLYEAWVATPESHKDKYVCLFEDAPAGLPVGANVSERIVFNGYFLKLMRYEAGDVPRGAPLLVGRIGWTPRPPPFLSANRSAYWLAGVVGVMFAISLARWTFQLRRSLGPRPRPSFLRDRANDEIAPEDLASFLEGVPADDPLSRGDRPRAGVPED